MSSRDCPAQPFDTDAGQILRAVARAAGEARASLCNLRRALEQPLAEPLPSTVLHADRALTAVITRASELAAERSAEAIARSDLYEALLEAEARAAGLDLNRLRLARRQVAQRYPLQPRLRAQLASPLDRRILHGGETDESN